uniref:Uncharacterized protein n=1 Tax=Cucumis melo TaxID=3656 RepID=A0A9I9DX46_CUCME
MRKPLGEKRNPKVEKEGVEAKVYLLLGVEAMRRMSFRRCTPLKEGKQSYSAALYDMTFVSSYLKSMEPVGTYCNKKCLTVQREKGCGGLPSSEDVDDLRGRG